MTDFLWPPDLIPELQTWRNISSAGTFQSLLTGSVRTVARPGSRMGCTITIPMTKGSDRARMVSIIGKLRIGDRIWMPDFTTTRVGSFPATEVFSNNDFSNGTTGWTAGQCTIAVQDRVLRLTNTKSAGSSTFEVSQNGVSVTQYASYVLRGFAKHPPRSGIAGGTYLESISNYSSSPDGMKSQATVMNGTTVATAYPVVSDSDGTISLAGDVAELYWCSLSRCPLVDNGPNALLQSDVFGTTWAVSQATISTNSVAAPDGTTTADTLNEDATAASQHYVSQSVTVVSTALDYSFSVSVKKGTRDWVYLSMTEATGGEIVYRMFNVNTGVTGASGIGSNWANSRAAIVSQGNGWYRCTITARKTNAATSIAASILIGESDGDVTFSGLSAASLYLWRGCLAQSSFPTRGAQTTTTATTGTSQTGSSLNIKGLPVSTSGLGKVGDPVQVGNQINFLSAALDSDAAGLGVLQTTMPWRVSPSDNDQVIFNTPMALMRLASDSTSWDTGPGQFSPFQLELVEDVT